MRYDQFRDALLDALREAKLRSPHIDRVTENIDTATTGRSFETYVADLSSEARTEPFHVSARVGFNWDPFESARSYTREDDLLTELLGRRQRTARTEPRYVRVDLELRASLPYGSATPMPDRETLGPWIEHVTDALADFHETRERKGRIVAILGGHGDLGIEAECKLDIRPKRSGVTQCCQDRLPLGTDPRLLGRRGQPPLPAGGEIERDRLLAGLPRCHLEHGMGGNAARERCSSMSHEENPPAEPCTSEA